MVNSILTVKEKAQIMFDEHNKALEQIYEAADEKRKKLLDEDRKKHPEEELTLDWYLQRFQEVNDLLEELTKYSHRKVSGVDLYTLNIDSYKGTRKSLGTKAFEDSRIVNLPKQPTLKYFLDFDLSDFYFKKIKLGRSSEINIPELAITGIANMARTGGELFATEYAEKALEYGIMPKVLAVYDAAGLHHIGGAEGYEHVFIESPKKSLLSIIKIDHVDKK